MKSILSLTLVASVLLVALGRPRTLVAQQEPSSRTVEQIPEQEPSVGAIEQAPETEGEWWNLILGSDGEGGGNIGTITGPPILTFWEGNGCSEEQVGWQTINSPPFTIPNRSTSGWENDEARSMKLFRVPAGRSIKVYDDSRGPVGDDWAEITVKRFLAERCIYSFQIGFEDEDVKVVYHPAGRGYKRNLDGKVSLVRVE